MTESDQQRAERVADRCVFECKDALDGDTIAARIVIALLEAQREVRRETLEQCLEIAKKFRCNSNCGPFMAEAIRALLAEEKVSG